MKYIHNFSFPYRFSHAFLGLCHGSSFDAHYGWTGKYSQGTEVYYFNGFKNSLLQYDNEKSQWKITTDTNSETYAILDGSSIYPFGTQKWNIFNDSCRFEQSSFLNYNGCNTYNEFNCMDGTW